MWNRHPDQLFTGLQHVKTQIFTSFWARISGMIWYVLWVCDWQPFNQNLCSFSLLNFNHIAQFSHITCICLLAEPFKVSVPFVLLHIFCGNHKLLSVLNWISLEKSTESRHNAMESVNIFLMQVEPSIWSQVFSILSQRTPQLVAKLTISICSNSEMLSWAWELIYFRANVATVQLRCRKSKREERQACEPTWTYEQVNRMSTCFCLWTGKVWGCLLWQIPSNIVLF